MTLQSTYPHEQPIPGKAADYAATLRQGLPTLFTERLALRPPVLEDFAAYREILMSDRARYMVDQPMTRETAWLDFAQCVGTWLLRGHGLWTIIKHQLTEYENGVTELHRDQTPLGFVLIGMEYGDREPELGWFLTEAAEGNGYAFEAARVARDHAITGFGLPSLVSYIDPPNTRSIALAQRLGATRDEQAESVFDTAVLVFRHHPRGALQ